MAILAMVVLDPGIGTITIALGLTGWAYMALLVRSRMLQLKNQEFVLTSRSGRAGRAWCGSTCSRTPWVRS